MGFKERSRRKDRSPWTRIAKTVDQPQQQQQRGRSSRRSTRRGSKRDARQQQQKDRHSLARRDRVESRDMRDDGGHSHKPQGEATAAKRKTLLLLPAQSRDGQLRMFLFSLFSSLRLFLLLLLLFFSFCCLFSAATKRFLDVFEVEEKERKIKEKKEKKPKGAEDHSDSLAVTVGGS
ncbi:uncharacterized protein ARB_04085 [Trichophyton benhamiae CBS 112371]|uniref:Transmembrane protein n=1 Tax=Arthroderma benhamiae (strain ATCC MYA-4681 / CBS 112371) TaxID=663331 RepID=D4AIJ0_ARTBC|nr:uncharacterized protein ARB_04085 [Trichophyton benhamiae CBS 112371]EFE36563.1 hypothetical protein ARB_04085 [Trichophyton benhamiae CBS 112371]